MYLLEITAGFVKAILIQDVVNNIVHVEQEWESSVALQSYLSSKEFQYLIGAITVLGELIEQRIINTTSVEEI